MKNYFIIHGAKGNQYANWFPWLYSKIENSGEKCFVPQFPTGGAHEYKQWKTILKGYAEAGIINEDTIFIAHSIGCVFITRFIVEMRIKVSGVIAVSGFNSDCLIEEYNDLNKNFLVRNKTLSKVGNYVKFYHCIYSDNDPKISMESLMDFAKCVNAKVHEIEGAGHLDSEAGYNEFPFIWDLIDKINTIV